ncbi:MAG: hypothetical protein ACKOA1_08585 [Bacteroidota bacterium]
MLRSSSAAEMTFTLLTLGGTFFNLFGLAMGIVSTFRQMMYLFKISLD